jgi:hypothetical protein
MKGSSDNSPVSFPVHVARLPKKGMPVTISATPKQREALARVHDLVSVDEFDTELVVMPWKRNGVRVDGRVTAHIVQSCVVTLEPLSATIDEPVSGIFLPEDSRLGRESFGEGGEIMIDVEGPDSPETFAGDTIDVGALAEEFFGLAIDPYPRKPDAQIDTAGVGEGEATEPSELATKLAQLFPRN